jgi:hypothetical protein
MWLFFTKAIDLYFLDESRREEKKLYKNEDFVKIAKSRQKDRLGKR